MSLTCEIEICRYQADKIKIVYETSLLYFKFIKFIDA